MQPTSSDFQAAVKRSHMAVSRCDVIRDGKVVMTLPVVDGRATSDATAAQRGQFEVTLGDPDGNLTPADMAAVLAPFGTRIQLFRGVRLPGIQIVRDVDNNAATFATGTNNGTIADPVTGYLTLGWGT